MYKLEDYINWRCDLSFNIDPLNEVDSLILSNIIYVRFTNIVTNEAITLKDATDMFLSQDKHKQIVRDIKDIEFIKKLSNTKRFGSIKLFNLKEVYDLDNEIQFGAMCYDLLNGQYYVAFRGTDNYIAGWKEDFNLTYKVIPSQNLSHTYLDEFLDTIHTNNKCVFIGGHSKGGNLAMYACAKIKKTNFNKLIHIYNNDGPGFDFNLVDKSNFDRLIPILTTFTPKTSIVASFFSNVGAFTIVDSNEFSFLEHNPYSWLLNSTTFTRINQVEDASLKTKELLESWLNDLSYKERENIADKLYELIILCKAENLNEIIPSLIKNPNVIKEYLKNLDEKTRRTIMSAISILFTSVSSSIGDNFKNIFKKD